MSADPTTMSPATLFPTTVEAFTSGPFGPALLGGAIIGLAAATFLVLTGRIAGISGIVGGLLSPRPGDFGWRLAFAIGMLAAGVGGLLFAPQLMETTLHRSPVMVVVAGLLVGFGTRLGNGCTSGHGVCGISRGSPRSLASVFTFIAAGVLTTTALRLLGVAA
jgi:uncharacterized membrane protein YedE/YeeE